MNNKIKIFSGLAIGFSMTTAVYATVVGFYMGAQGGQSNLHNIQRPMEVGTTTGSTMSIENVSPTNTGAAGRFFAGYTMNSYAALEGGFTHYAPSTYTPSAANATPPSTTIRENGFDAVGKAMYSFANLGVFLKAGAAFIQSSLGGSFSAAASSGNTGTTIYIRPTAAAGISYDITPNWVVDLSYSTVFASGDFQQIDFIALGISYHFVDKYCGQFLC